MKNNSLTIILISIILLLSITSCGSVIKINKIKKNNYKPQLILPDNQITTINSETHDSDTTSAIKVKTDLQGEALLMKTVYNKENGETIIADKLNEIVVEAPFRNIPERNGQIKLSFDIIIPAQLISSNWQLRFMPQIFFGKDTSLLNPIYITGEKYRKKQLRGYELYEKYLKSILPDTSNVFTYISLLEIFMDRNGLADLDSEYGKKVLEYYTKDWLLRRNKRKKENKDKMREKYIKNPLLFNLKLDTVIKFNEKIQYKYSQILKSKPIPKIDLLIKGTINNQQETIYELPSPPKLTYYISSIANLMEEKIKYREEIVEKNVFTSTLAYIDFKTGDAEIYEDLWDNRLELNRIKENLKTLITNKEYVLDSVAIISSCSPEGAYKLNESLSRKRGEVLKKYLDEYSSYIADSLNNIWVIDLQNANSIKEEILLEPIKYNVNSIAENWDKLETYVKTDTNLTYNQKEEILHQFSIINEDKREKEISKLDSYKYLRQVIYPKLRTSKFKFYLHKRGMIKDTIITTEVDEHYMKGLAALKNRDFKEALSYLKEYKDINTAVAYLCLDYNLSAYEILEKTGLQYCKDSKALYMKALAKVRLKQYEESAKFLKEALIINPALRFRVNLDPELNMIAKSYDINLEEAVNGDL